MGQCRRKTLGQAIALATLVASAQIAQGQDAAEEEDGYAARGDSDAVVITATRSGQLVRDQPLRVEVVPNEEIEENLTVAPGNLTNVLNELAGVRMQAAAPGLGGTALQFRGLPGRHAQILSDGLQLGSAQTDSFSLMQTPPLDLGRVEVIKGVASALYGASALSGVLNLTSREPGDESDVLVNQTSRGGSDLVGFLAGHASKALGYTLTGGAHYQSREDADHDGWAEQPGYKRASLRPRVYWETENDGKVFATLGIMSEDRHGGTLPGRELPSGESFAEALHTRRVDAGAVASFKTDESRIISARWSANVVEHDRVFGTQRVWDRGRSMFGEAAIQGETGIHKWVAGAAIQLEELRVPDVPGVGYSYAVPGVFVQDELNALSWLSLAASARVDVHSDYGTFLSPRLSALFRTGSNWSVRASAGTGFAAPTPLIEEVEARSLGLVNPLRGLRAERAKSASIDVKWVARPLDVNVSVFASEVRNPLDIEAAVEPGRLELINEREPLESVGAEVLIGVVTGDLHLLANASYLDVTEGAPSGGRRTEELIPRVTAEIAAILEEEDRGRVGIEISYTGSQRLWDDPFRATSRSYVEVNALAEVKFGRAAVFLNALNLTNVRQQSSAPLLRPTPGLGGEPITGVWAPLIGRTFNVGVRLRME